MALKDVPDDAYPLPERRDGVDEWHRNHERAALLRAQDWSWREVADEIGVAESTATTYTRHDGFKDLVSHFEAFVRRKRIEQSDLETLEVICKYKPKVLKSLAKQALDGSPYAGEQFLKAIGFFEHNKALGEREADDQGDSGGGGEIVINNTIE